ARSVEVLPAAELAVGIGDTVSFRAVVLDGRGRAVEDASVIWRVSDPGIATVDAGGRATAMAEGTTTVSARCGDAHGSASLEVYVPDRPAEWVPGRSYLGRRGYVEYVPGELPVVVSVPHGGALEPAEIPDRTSGTLVTDRNTRETAQAVRQAFVERNGLAPHVIVSHLRRTKLDPNREIVEAAQGNPFAEQAWREFQAFIDLAEETVEEQHGSGFYLDLHGHGHEIPRVEIGYLLTAGELALPDSVLDAGDYAEMSSIRALAQASPWSFSQILRGVTSLGAYLEARGVAAVPAPSDPAPGSAPYFSGGYNTARHGSRAPDQVVSGVQLELPFSGIRDTEANREAFGRTLAAAMDDYMDAHGGVSRSRVGSARPAFGVRPERPPMPGIPPGG
ncbi:MAG: Ig-like domain-containing protein, partial [Gemmatimonadota bacterium]